MIFISMCPNIVALKLKFKNYFIGSSYRFANGPFIFENLFVCHLQRDSNA